ncbi:MAG: DUF4097 family beta strand repeat protein [Gemmatimonadota bacterium]|nr:DUF4097 family beta strand repeat protein [Gemmatimonadota bacterium]
MPIRPAIASLALGAALALPAALHAQQDRADRWLDQCRHDDWGDRARYCDVRQFTVDHPAESVHIDAGPNGGVNVFGWDKPSMLVVAKIQTNADDDAAAKDLAGQLRITANESRVESNGPSNERHRGWSVSYDVYLPTQRAVDVSTRNGGVSVERVTGHLDLSTVNGGIHLTDVAGDVRAETTNGGVSAALSGTTWTGQGLDLRTTNGGVTLEIPTGYNARLETGTVNGGFSTDFPITVQGSFRKRISTTLGSGGPLIRATTVNGGVRIRTR